MSTNGSFWQRARRTVGQVLVDGAFTYAARLGRLHPRADPSAHGLERLTDIPYQNSGQREHLLDVYRPAARNGSLPVVIYLHGGGFRILSKESHWLMGLAFARRGYLVFNINYRLAPHHRYPAAVEDACAAFSWVVENAHRYGGNPDQLVLAGESAGANLAAALAILTCYERPEPFARAVFDLARVPRAVSLLCGLLQVSDPKRFSRDMGCSWFMDDRMSEIAEAYLPPDQSHELADPVVFLERGQAPARPLPAFQASVGTADPLHDDTRRLKRALDRLGTACEACFYPGELHAFQAFVWRRHARQAWRDTYAFLDRHVPAPKGAAL
ncbi:MAG: alpha/beta hydrolase [Deltaproteobacteria bacterium]|nr:alpha/beta hydrolase [Deltaproteobacteria bacterium]